VSNKLCLEESEDSFGVSMALSTWRDALALLNCSVAYNPKYCHSCGCHTFECSLLSWEWAFTDTSDLSLRPRKKSSWLQQRLCWNHLIIYIYIYICFALVLRFRWVSCWAVRQVATVHGKACTALPPRHLLHRKKSHAADGSKKCFSLLWQVQTHENMHRHSPHRDQNPQSGSYDDKTVHWHGTNMIYYNSRAWFRASAVVQIKPGKAYRAIS